MNNLWDFSQNIAEPFFEIYTLSFGKYVGLFIGNKHLKAYCSFSFH